MLAPDKSAAYRQNTTSHIRLLLVSSSRPVVLGYSRLHASAWMTQEYNNTAKHTYMLHGNTPPAAYFHVPATIFDMEDTHD